MPQGLQALVALLVLLPGFISARIVRALSAQSQQSELERIVEALIFSFLTYVFYVLVFGTTLPIDWTSTVDPFHVQHYGVTVYRWRIVFLAGIACVLGFVWGLVRSKDWLLALLRHLKVTVRTSRDSVWNDVFYNLEGTVQVGLADGRNLIGWIKRYSDSGGERSLFLEKAYWVQGEDLIEITGEGILLTEKAGIEYVMFLDPSSKRK